VVNAVRSALNQTYRNIEVIVVIDGQDDTTEQALAQICDSRLRVIVWPTNEGGANARNVGVGAAFGKWIAFLDDDDEWLPQKTEVQFELAQKSRHRFPVISSKFVARTPECDFVWPRRSPSPGEDISNYLFSRKSLFQGEGFMATPTLMAPRALLKQVPFRAHIKKHEDWDWVVRAAKSEGVGFEFSDEPLALVRMGSKHKGMSNSDDWRFSLSWIQERRSYVTPHAYASFILTVVADQASRQATLKEYMSLPFESWRGGDPNLFHLMLYAGMRVFPRSFRHNLRRKLETGG
jgi:glycosyltransferase involved in cell wall biosynthesis